MEKFEVNILGCGSALPTLRHYPTSQVVNLHEKLFMIDCGEGTQLQMRRARLPFSRLNHIFISHLHGDHCFGLPGLISTFALLGRTAPLHIHAPGELEHLLRPLLDYHCKGATFTVEFHPFETKTPTVIFEDKSVEVTAIPMRHRIACCGFVLREKPGLPHIRRDMVDFHGIPLYEIVNIKQGADWQKPDGTIIPNSWLVTPAEPARSYAYYSDTAFVPENAQYIQGVSLLFHEATFAENDKTRADETLHSTARQAAKMAKMAKAGALLIGHFSSRYDSEQQLLNEARKVFPNTTLAHEGLCYAIGSDREESRTHNKKS